jgi:hypothetical protein
MLVLELPQQLHSLISAVILWISVVDTMNIVSWQLSRQIARISIASLLIQMFNLSSEFTADPKCKTWHDIDPSKFPTFWNWVWLQLSAASELLLEVGYLLTACQIWQASFQKFIT